MIAAVHFIPECQNETVMSYKQRSYDTVQATVRKDYSKDSGLDHNLTNMENTYVCIQTVVTICILMLPVTMSLDSDKSLPVYQFHLHLFPLLYMVSPPALSVLRGH